MTSIALEGTAVIVGVDTHKDVHVAFAINGLGARLGVWRGPATTTGYEALLSWAHDLGEVAAFGVEGTGSYGLGLTRFLIHHDAVVLEVNRPDRAQRRRHGKDDTLDAEAAARAVLGGTATAIAKPADGIVEMIRLVKIVRDGAVTARSQAMITLKSVLVTAPDDLRDRLEPLTDHALITACAALDSDQVTTPADTARYTLATLARRWLHLHDEIKSHTRHLRRLTTEANPRLVNRFGVGFDTAAEVLIAAGDNPQRIHSEAALAKLFGTAPLPASSGQTTRHRLNRSGNRQANAALYRVIITRLRWHQPTHDYVARRTAEGRTKREIIRCLKRYLTREIYQDLTTHTT